MGASTRLAGDGAGGAQGNGAPRGPHRPGRPWGATQRRLAPAAAAPTGDPEGRSSSPEAAPATHAHTQAAFSQRPPQWLVEAPAPCHRAAAGTQLGRDSPPQPPASVLGNLLGKHRLQPAVGHGDDPSLWPQETTARAGPRQPAPQAQKPSHTNHGPQRTVPAAGSRAAWNKILRNCPSGANKDTPLAGTQRQGVGTMAAASRGAADCELVLLPSTCLRSCRPQGCRPQSHPPRASAGGSQGHSFRGRDLSLTLVCGDSEVLEPLLHPVDGRSLLRLPVPSLVTISRSHRNRQNTQQGRASEE